MKAKYDFSANVLICSLVLCFALVATVGCSVPDVVQKAVIGLNVLKSGINEAKALQPELQSINPELAVVISRFSAFAEPNVDNMLKVGNDYLAKPSGDKYQALLNAMDAFTQNVDKNVLAAAHVVNPQSQQRVLASLTVISIGSHGLLEFLEHKASSSQLKAMPVITARVDFQEIKRLVDRDYVRKELVRQLGPADANEVMELAGL